MNAISERFSHAIQQTRPARNTVELFLHVIAPITVEDPVHGLKRADMYAQRGAGTLIVSTHPRQRDPFDVLNAAWSEAPTLETKQVTGAMAAHQFKPAARGIAKVVDIKLMPVVTEHTLAYITRKKAEGKGIPSELERILTRLQENEPKDPKTNMPKYTKPYVGQGTREYVATAREALLKGDTVILTPSGERQETLHLPNNNAVALLLTSLPSDANVTILPVGIEIAGVTEYKKGVTDGLGKLFSRSIVRFGPAYPTGYLRDVVLPRVREENHMPQRTNSYRGADEFFFKEIFPTLVSPHYLPRQLQEGIETDIIPQNFLQ